MTLRKVVCAFLIMSLTHLVFAANKIDSYSATVMVTDQSESQRNAAFLQAIHEVVTQLSADFTLKQQQSLSMLFTHPAQYVTSFSYVADPDQPETLAIHVQFDQETLRHFFIQKHDMLSQRVDLQISGITSEFTLNALMHYLHHIDSIKSLTITQISDDRVILMLLVQGSLVNFIHRLLAEQRLVTLDREDSSTSSMLHFKWTA